MCNILYCIVVWKFEGAIVQSTIIIPKQYYAQQT